MNPIRVVYDAIIFSVARIYRASAAHFPTYAVSDPVGEWLSLVEHLLREQGVGGSNPLSPTNYFKYFEYASVFSSTAWGCVHARDASS